MYQETERHEMELVETHANGAEEWLCPICSRRFIMQWPPNYKRVILEAGDEDAIHSGGKSGVRMETDRGSLQIGLAEELEEHDDDGDPGLSPLFLAAIDELDFGPLDNRGGGSEQTI